MILPNEKFEKGSGSRIRRHFVYQRHLIQRTVNIAAKKLGAKGNPYYIHGGKTLHSKIRSLIRALRPRWLFCEERVVDAHARRSNCRVAVHSATVVPWSSPALVLKVRRLDTVPVAHLRIYGTNSGSASPCRARLGVQPC